MAYALRVLRVATGLLLASAQLPGCGDDSEPQRAFEAGVEADHEGADGGDAGAAGDASRGADARAASEADGSAEHLADAGAADAGVSALDAGPLDSARRPDVDLLFVIDNSASMASKQARLVAQLPHLLEVLTSGDRCAAVSGRADAGAADAGLSDAGAPSPCPFDDGTTVRRHFQPVRSLHVGVVTTNVGGIDDPTSPLRGLQSCAGVGDDGKLQNSVSVAVDGVIASSNEFVATPAGTTVIEPDPSCAQSEAVPLYQDYVAGSSAAQRARLEDTFRCTMKVGVRGCPFEQSLESPWKALAPSTGVGGDFLFLNDTLGQGDRYNAGFLRSDAMLAIVLLTDEDDCSITNTGKVLFVSEGSAGQAAQSTYGAINLRCGNSYQNNELIRGTNRYLRGFRSLKPGHPERVVFAAITGVPVAAVAAGKTPSELLALPELQFTEDPYNTGLPRISCSNDSGSEVAYPPIRIVELARDFGEQGLVTSICADDYSAAIDGLVDKLSLPL